MKLSPDASTRPSPSWISGDGLTPVIFSMASAVEVVLQDRADLEDALVMIMQGASRAEVEHPGRALRGRERAQGLAERCHCGDLADADDQHRQPRRELRRLRIHGDDDERPGR